MNRTIVTVAAFLALGFSGVVHAASVGIKLKGVSGSTLSAGETAGATGYAQQNWNNIAANGQGAPTTPVNDLIGGDGLATTVDLTSWSQVSDNSWTTNDTASSNAKLITDFSDSQPSLSFASLGSEFTGPGYSVVVYYADNEDHPAINLSVTGSTNDTASRLVDTNLSLAYTTAGGFVEETGNGDNNGHLTNFTVFSGLNDPGFTLAMTGTGNHGISAVQIVSAATPEPASAAVLGIGALALLRRRRTA